MASGGQSSSFRTADGRANPPCCAPDTLSAGSPSARAAPIHGGAGNLIPELNAALFGCAIITATGGTLTVEPLQFIGLSNASGQVRADLPRFHHAVATAALCRTAQSEN